MPVNYFDSLGRSICVVRISAYQKYLSPHKGFACADRVLYQGESCSQYIKTLVAHEGIKRMFEKFGCVKFYANRLTIIRIIAMYTNVSAVSGNSS